MMKVENIVLYIITINMIVSHDFITFNYDINTR